MRKKEIREIMESRNFSQAVFDCDLVGDLGMLPEFNALYDALPPFLQQGIEAHIYEIEENWDEKFWGSDSVIQICIVARSVADVEVRDRLDEWKDDQGYVAFCSGIEKAIWAWMKSQENFEKFDSIMARSE